MNKPSFKPLIGNAHNRSDDTPRRRPSVGKSVILNTWSLFARGHGSETGFWNRDVLNPSHRLSAVHRAGPK